MSISQKKQQPQADYTPVIKAQQAAAKDNYSPASVKKMEKVWETYKAVGK